MTPPIVCFSLRVVVDLDMCRLFVIRYLCNSVPCVTSRLTWTLELLVMLPTIGACRAKKMMLSSQARFRKLPVALTRRAVTRMMMLLLWESEVSESLVARNC